MNKENLTIPQGATYVHEFTVLDKITTLPIDLTGYALRMQIREDYDAATALVSLTSTVGGGLTLGGASNNVITVEISSSLTTGLAAGNYVYDLEVVSPSSKVTRLVEGKAKVTPEVTK